ncbi:MAG TPA: T9SS type A sorting domain-containing protein [Candidatus Cloacimonetes bacterium]|nr:T9SS type A sorting domain-containing protein [Candidatus Cloacimonadota bacterium]HEX37446.1 T9SS type A sorting domain-containing protein [Candidatus Cloacimonadota bacterium]
MKKLLTILFISLFAASVVNADILVVDHDLSEGGYTDCWPWYETALIANGYTYTYYQVGTDLITPDLATMQLYDCIIWFSGECWGYYGDDCMTPESEAKVASYLDGGGSLFFAGQDYLWASYPSAGALNPGQFPYDYLGLASVSQDMWFIEDPDVLSVDGATGSCVEGYSFTASDIFTTAKEGLYVDQILTFTTDAIGLFQVTAPAPAGMCATQTDNGVFRSIFSSLAWAAIDDPTTQNDIFGDMIDWLLGGGVSVDEPSVMGSFVSAPNPFINSTTFSFALKEAAHVKVDVYNVKGQLVRTLADQNMMATSHSITWDGKDLHGNNVPSGVYFTKLSTDNVEEVHKVMVIR